MAPPNLPSAQPIASREALEAAAERAGRDWKQLWLRFRTTSPRSLMRTLLVVATIWLTVIAITRAGTALMPFWIGIVVAYITAPLVRWLDSFLPRTVAVILVLLLELAMILLFFAILVPALVTQISALVRALPDREILRARLDQMLVSVRVLPPGIVEFLRGWLENGYETLQANFGVYLRQAVQWGIGTALGLLGSVTFLLGFLVVPQWLVAVLSSNDAGSRWLDRTLADWLRPDFWATVRIIDRTFAIYVRARVLVAIAVGMFTWIGLALLPYIGLPPMPYINAIALITIVLNLIPVIGPILAALPPLVLAMSISWQQTAFVLGLILGAHVLKWLFVTPRVENRAVDIHPAILAFIVVLASQFGLVWAVLAGPIAVAVRDLYRYAYGRLSVPSRPAGVLPGTAEMALVLRNQPVAPLVPERASGD